MAGTPASTLDGEEETPSGDGGGVTREDMGPS